MATPEKCIYVFTSKLGCKKNISTPVNDDAEASMLPCFLENESSRCTLPSLRLGKSFCLTSSEEETVEELKSSLEARKATIALAPTALLQNVSRSFGTMIDNRIKQVHLMINADENDKEHDVSLKLASLLCSEENCPTSFVAAESSFRPLPLSKGHIKEVGRTKAVILPLIFKATITINVLGVKERKVTIVAPGTVVGTFQGSCTRLRTAEVTLDTSAIYTSMKDRCDEVVAFTFETASQMLNDGLSGKDPSKNQEGQSTAPSSGPSSCRIKSPSEGTTTSRSPLVHYPVSPWHEWNFLTLVPLAHFRERAIDQLTRTYIHRTTPRPDF